ncbi:uncharacterized protein Tco025E_02505 [Trypanosoma conorhini]|uniref:Uncharacterized protein n=1 Tax=Trypanosoma conorhini TaxID=83891 RepID=A0A3R7LCR3_9TRYP|nr:uncharacterized protein Tco025E_02505 [Trypanosoma conorhini]RNF24654.1 hypothetical protein Tco025E_02505 [Trypanosoma conorhini]
MRLLANCHIVRRCMCLAQLLLFLLFQREEVANVTKFLKFYFMSQLSGIFAVVSLVQVSSTQEESEGLRRRMHPSLNRREGVSNKWGLIGYQLNLVEFRVICSLLWFSHAAATEMGTIA